MARATRSNDWGFPRWRGYGGKREAAEVRRFDRHGCDEAGDRPAPKASKQPDRWYFCERYAAEYNSNWTYYEGMTAEAADASVDCERECSKGLGETSEDGGGG